MDYLVSLRVDEEQLKKENIKLQSNLALDVFYVIVKDVDSAADLIDVLYEWLEDEDCLLTSLPELPLAFGMSIIPSEEQTEELLNTLEPIIAILNEPESDTPLMDKMVRHLN